MNTNTQPGEEHVLEGNSRLLNRPRTSKGKRYNAIFVYVPQDVAKDSLFPFKPDEDVVVRIDVRNKRLVIEKAGDENINGDSR